MKTRTKLWVSSNAVVIPILLVGYILTIEKFLTTNQYVVLSMGCLSAISVFSAMIEAKENTILKRHSILITLFILSIIGFITAFLMAFELDLTFEFAIFLGIFLSGFLGVPLVDWNAKRKQTIQSPSTPNNITSKC